MYIIPVDDSDTILKYYSASMSSGISVCILVVASSSVITVFRLLRKNKLDEKISKNNRHAKIIILILSSTFCVLNATFVSAGLISFCTKLKLIEDSALLWSYRDIVFSLAQCLNSAVNPMIYKTRKKEIRQFVQEILRTVKDKASGSR